MSKKKIKGVSKTLKPGEKPAPSLDLEEVSRESDAQGPLTPEEMKRWGITAPGMADDLEPWEQEADPWESEEKDPWEQEPEEPSTLKKVAEWLPTVGGIGGGIGGGLLGGPVGGAVGGMGGAAGGKVLENYIEEKYLNEPKTLKEKLVEPAVEGGIGLLSEVGGQALFKGVPKLYRMMKPLPPKVATHAPVPNTFPHRGFKPVPKPNAEAITESTRRMGAEPTSGMLSANTNVQNLESILSQKPTIYGDKMRSEVQSVLGGLERTSGNAVEHSMTSPLQTGDQVKGLLKERVRGAAKPLSQSFEDIRGNTKNIVPAEDSLKRASGRLAKQPIGSVEGLPAHKIISDYSGMIRNAKSLDELKMIRTNVNEQMTNAFDNGLAQQGLALEKVKNSITRLERREIIKAAMASMPTKAQGQNAAKSLIDQIKATNKGWAALMRELEKVSDATGVRSPKNPEHFIRIIEDLDSEKLARKMFNTKNYKGLTDVKKFAPQEFEILKNQKLSDMAAKIMSDGKPDPRKLIKVMEAEGPEARRILFGDKSETLLKDLKNVVYSMPKKVGGSDTPRGNMWSKFEENVWNIANPAIYGSELSSAYSYMLTKGGAIPRLRDAVGTGVRGLLPTGAKASGFLLAPRGRESEE